MTTSDVHAQLERFKRDTAYYCEHWEELLEKYPEQWIAVFNEQVAAVAPDLDELLACMETRGVPAGQGLVEYLTRQDELLILPP